MWLQTERSRTPERVLMFVSTNRRSDTVSESVRPLMAITTSSSADPRISSDSIRPLTAMSPFTSFRCQSPIDFRYPAP